MSGVSPAVEPAAASAGSREDVAPAVLDVAGVKKSYGSIRALDGVDMRVSPGEFVALLGPNGAGKTTLLQLLTGLFVADAGDIEVAGFDIRRNPVSALAHVGVVFQQPTLDLDLTVRANLSFHARLHGMGSRGKAGIGAALAQLEIEEHAGKPCRALSGGNRRKVELARALLHEPSLLLMDEATVGLDPGSRRLLIDSVHALCASRGLGVLWTTHLVDEAERADRVLVLHKGKLLRAGTPRSLCEETGEPRLADAFLKLTGTLRAKENGV